jgi:hypothetical protein
MSASVEEVSMATGLAQAADTGFLDRCGDPGAFIVRACEQATAHLRKALENGDIDQVAEIRSQAETVLRACSPQERLGKDTRLAATEFLRRAERALGLAIRQGQAAGTIRGPHNGRELPKPGTAPMRQVGEFATVHELTGGSRRDDSQVGIYDLVDGVRDEDFEAALKEARDEGNLFRSNVVRKARARGAATADPGDDWIPGARDRYGDAPLQRRRLIRKWAAGGHSSSQMGALLGMGAEGVRRVARGAGIAIPADMAVAGSRHLDSARIVRETVHSLEGLVMGIELADAAGLDPAEAVEWAASLTSSIRVLSRFARKLKETAHE